MNQAKGILTSIFLCVALTLTLRAQEQAHGKPQALSWHAMGSSPCAWSVPITQSDGNIDIDATVRGLQSAGFKCDVYVIQGAGRFESYQKLLEAMKNTDIEMWAVIIPPSEGSTSLPYRSDYIGWSKELASLSLKYKNFRGFNIDDLDIDSSHATFTRDYVCKIYDAKKEINPNLLFIPTIYDLDRTVADRVAGCVDGVWLWWVNLEKTTGLQSFLENTRYAVDGRFPIYGGVYAHWTSWHKQGNPEPTVFRKTLETTCKYADGALIWQLSLKPGEPLLEATKPFLAGGASPYTGNCGTGRAPNKPGESN